MNFTLKAWQTISVQTKSIIPLTSRYCLLWFQGQYITRKKSEVILFSWCRLNIEEGARPSQYREIMKVSHREIKKQTSCIKYRSRWDIQDDTYFNCRFDFGQLLSATLRSARVVMQIIKNNCEKRQRPADSTNFFRVPYITYTSLYFKNRITT